MEPRSALEILFTTMATLIPGTMHTKNCNFNRNWTDYKLELETFASSKTDDSKFIVQQCVDKIQIINVNHVQVNVGVQINEVKNISPLKGKYQNPNRKWAWTKISVIPLIESKNLIWLNLPNITFGVVTSCSSTLPSEESNVKRPLKRLGLTK